MTDDPHGRPLSDSLLKTNIPRKAYVALLIVYLIWGTTTGMIRLAVETFDPILLPCLRFMIAGFLLTGFCLLRGERLPGRRDFKTHLMIALLLFVGGNSLVCWAMQHVTSGFGGIMVATTPLWMVWLSAVMPPREKIPLLSLLGVLIGFLGMLALLFPQLADIHHTSSGFWTCLAALLMMAFFWSVGSIYARKHTTGNSLLMSVGIQNLLAGVILMPFCAAFIPDWHALHPSPAAIGALAYLILFGTIVATPCYVYTVKVLPVSVSSTFAYVTPVLTILFGWLFLRESVTPAMLAGIVIILSGVGLAQSIQRAQATEESPPCPENPLPSPPLSLESLPGSPFSRLMQASRNNHTG